MEDHHSVGYGSEAAPKDAVDKGCGMFDFLKKKDHEEKPTDDMAMADAEKPQEVKKEEDKPTLMEKLHRSNSSSSSSSDEGGGEGAEKKMKKKKKEEDCAEKKDGCIPGEKCDAAATNPEEKKGLMEKIKEKLPGQGQHKKADEVADVHSSDEDAKDKKGFLEKIKAKLPGSHKNEGEEKSTNLVKND